MEIFAIPIVMIGLLYMIYPSIHDKKSPLLAFLCIVFFVGMAAFAANLYAAVRTTYLGHPEWAVERAYFLGMFADKLAETNDLKSAAEFMQTEAVKEQTLHCIRQIVLSFRPKTIFYLSVGGLILLLSVISLRIKRFAGSRLYPFILIFFVLAGGILFDFGVYYRQYASGTDKHLKTFLCLQQTSVMKDLAEMKTDRSIPEIIRLTREEAGKSGYGYGNRLLFRLQEKDKGGK